MSHMISSVISVLIIGLFLYAKLLPHKDRLDNPYNGIFNFFNNVFSPILIFLRKFIKPFQIGKGLAIDMTQIILLILFLLILNF